MTGRRYLQIRLTFEEREETYLLDISSLLYDLELLYDLSVLVGADEYAHYRFTRGFWYRSGRPIRDEHRLRAGAISRGSPLLLELLVPILGVPAAVYYMLRCLDMVRDWGPSRERRQLELEKLRREAKILAIDEERAWQDLNQALSQRGAAAYQDNLLRRLKRSPLALTDVRVLAPPDGELPPNADGDRR
jgi:hypothetical protein